MANPSQRRIERFLSITGDSSNSTGDSLPAPGPFGSALGDSRMTLFPHDVRLGCRFSACNLVKHDCGSSDARSTARGRPESGDSWRPSAITHG